MRFKIKIANRTFQVDVEDPDSRPVIATVEGTRFEVWPEAEVARPVTTGAEDGVAPPAGLPAQPAPRMSRRTSGAEAEQAGGSRHLVYAPIPGVILSVAVQPDDAVDVGQELCILEAMKMKNIIRASRAGKIGGILVSPGQRVKHNDPLIEYAE